MDATNDHTDDGETPPPYHAIYKEVRTQEVSNSLTSFDGMIYRIKYLCIV